MRQAIAAVIVLATSTGLASAAEFEGAHVELGYNLGHADSFDFRNPYGFAGVAFNFGNRFGFQAGLTQDFYDEDYKVFDFFGTLDGVYADRRTTAYFLGRYDATAELSFGASLAYARTSSSDELYFGGFPFYAVSNSGHSYTLGLHALHQTPKSRLEASISQEDISDRTRGLVRWDYDVSDRFQINSRLVLAWDNIKNDGTDSSVMELKLGGTYQVTPMFGVFGALYQSPSISVDRSSVSGYALGLLYWPTKTSEVSLAYKDTAGGDNTSTVYLSYKWDLGGKDRPRLFEDIF